jgi:aminoglycoside 6'-N-acetyltransferase I
MIYRPYNDRDFKDWLAMGLELWPDYTKKELELELLSILKNKQQTTFIAQDDKEYSGFINVSLRFEYVEGASSSPVGYIEGIYIKSKYRKQGIASELLKIAEEWALKKGATEIASDTWLKNKSSQIFHKKIGFKVADTIVHFVKKI